ncbi:hypothetical protein ACLOJK_026166 [Asimina triloba]
MKNGNQETSTPARKQVPTTSVGSSAEGQQTRRVEDDSELHKAKNDQLDVEKNSWWLKLPYVFLSDLVVLFLEIKDTTTQLPCGVRVGDGESPKGLYSLKTISYSDDEGSGACTVTFEDRRDANNFCHVLESFFEGLGDFRAEALPLSINEMKEALKSSSLKAIVVKKGQLQLYAGQPLEDVEMALHSMSSLSDGQNTVERAATGGTEFEVDVGTSHQTGVSCVMLSSISHIDERQIVDCRYSSAIVVIKTVAGVTLVSNLRLEDQTIEGCFFDAFALFSYDVPLKD